MSEGIDLSLIGWQAEAGPLGRVVWPLNDLRKHVINSARCWCRPYYDECVLVHNSADGREKYERGERKAS